MESERSQSKSNPPATPVKDEKKEKKEVDQAEEKKEESDDDLLPRLQKHKGKSIGRGTSTVLACVGVEAFILF